MRNRAALLEVLAAFGLAPPLDISSRGSAGGFSGAQFWLVRTAGKEFCLRQWPQEHPDRDRLQYIHAVLKHVVSCGVWEVTAPLAMRDGRTFIERAGHFWELTRWVTGAADESDPPNPVRVAAALQVLARFHLAAATFSQDPPTHVCSPGLIQRAESIAHLQQGGHQELQNAVTPAIWPQAEKVVRCLLNLFPRAASAVLPRLSSATSSAVDLQPCIRDIWRAHVFFEEDRVSGLVDFGAMRDECTAGDVARLLGSYAADDEHVWRTGLAAYQSVRELSPAELALVRVFDETSVLLSGVNWIRWIYVEQRRFADQEKILQRLEVTLGRLEHLTQQGGGLAAE